MKEEAETYNSEWRSPIGKYQYHYRLTRHEYIDRRRYHPSDLEIFAHPISDLQPSQLYISEGKLRLVNEWFDPQNKTDFDPIPVRRFEGKILMTDGHTRAVAACLAGWNTVPVYLDNDSLDMEAYLKDLAWCEAVGIRSPHDLVKRIVHHKDYEVLWRKRCMEG
jgi:hypothetical protein